MSKSYLEDCTGFVKLRERLGVDIYDNIQSSHLSNILAYIIDSRYRTVKDLSPWIKKQVDNPTQIIKEVLAKIPSKTKPDEQVIEVLKFVINNLTYTTDNKQYSKNEFWAKASETLYNLKGDCEDGAILMYVLCRLKGIPANRLYVWAGDVKSTATAPTGGHSCLLYKSTYFPYNFIPLDWCYYPNKKLIKQRNLLELKGKDINEFNKLGNIEWSNYRRTWFIFNEDKSFSRLKLR